MKACWNVALCALVAAALVGCSKKSAPNGSGQTPATATPVVTSNALKSGDGSEAGPGRIAYLLQDRKAYLLEAKAGAKPVQIDAALDRLSKGEDDAVHLARDGSWLAVSTTRFGCSGWACLAVVRGDLSSGNKVEADGDVVHADGTIAIAPAGAFIVYSQSGKHDRDLFLTRRTQEEWSEPLQLTGDSPFAYNTQPSISHDGTKIVFDCGAEPYGGEGTGLCEVGANGKGFRAVMTPGTGWVKRDGSLHHPDYAPDGSIVVEASREDGERIWRLSSGKEPERLGNFNNDNSPCVLPNGNVVSLWLNRPGGKGVHEIKVMSPDGTNEFMALIDADVLDSKISCGR